MSERIETSGELWHELMYTMSRVRHAVRRSLGPYQLRGPMVPVLRMVGAAGDDGIRLSDIAEHLVVSPAHITRLVDDMEAEGYVQRRPDPDDRRALRVVLTEQGAQLEETIRPILERFSTDLLSALKPSEQKRLRDYLRRLAERADELCRSGDEQ
ncbi:MAG: MarR family transcriptional regulator [Armatimonadetes bacterium]|nr:MarR family transcriptional regulator [Armatimonadota bacterium]